MSKENFLNGRLGAFASGWDYRNFRVDRATLKQVRQLPVEYEGLLTYAPTDPWPDQGDIGTCVGWDGDVVMEITNTLLELYALRTKNLELLRYVTKNLSAGWMYHWSKKKSEPPIPDWIEGSTNFGLMKALNHIGTTTEECCPTDTASPWGGINPCEEAETIAAQHAIDSYWNVNPNPNDIKAAIYGLAHEAPYLMPDGSPGKIPLISAYPVYESFKESYDNGIVPTPKIGEALLGGHSSCILGWKIIDGKEYFINFNSWGQDVGDSGLFYIPINYQFYSTDWFLIHNGPPTEDPDDDISPCSRGNSLAGFANWSLRKLRRKGRFSYGNPR